MHIICNHAAYVKALCSIFGWVREQANGEMGVDVVIGKRSLSMLEVIIMRT